MVYCSVTKKRLGEAAACCASLEIAHWLILALALSAIGPDFYLFVCRYENVAFLLMFLSNNCMCVITFMCCTIIKLPQRAAKQETQFSCLMVGGAPRDSSCNLAAEHSDGQCCSSDGSISGAVIFKTGLNKHGSLSSY